MGFNDHLGDGLDLPREAGDPESHLFDPNDDWLKSAPEEEQIEAMRRWFYARYEDPANGMPYCSQEGGFQFIWGGPYDPNDVIQERFDDVVTFDVMEKLIHELWREAGDKWAPVEPEGLDYDNELSSLVLHRTDPIHFLNARLDQVDEVLDLNMDQTISELVIQMAHSSIIAALEAFLAETTTYWIVQDRNVLQQFISSNKDFKQRTLTLDQLFARLADVEEEVKLYLQELVWHRLDKIKPMMRAGLGIDIPDIADLMKEVVVRHDIVHRAGRTKDGALITVSSAQVLLLRDNVRRFAEAIVAELKKRFPV